VWPWWGIACCGQHLFRGGEPRSQLDGGCIEKQNKEAEAIGEADVDLSALELQQARERKGVQPGQGWAARAAEEVDTGTFAILCAGVVRGEQGVEAGLGRVLGKLALQVQLCVACHLCSDLKVV
jgi:hypothetical protein